MRKNFVFVVAILALTAFTIGVVSITKQVSAQSFQPSETKSAEEGTTDKPKIPDNMREKMERELEKAIEELDKEHVPAFVELNIPEWWIHPPKFENHIVFGRGVAEFDEMDELQNAIDSAQRSACNEIVTKLGGEVGEYSKEILGFGHWELINLREFNNEIIKTEDGYAYLVVMTYSYYNLALLKMDPGMFPQIKEILHILEEYGAFDPMKPLIHEKDEPFRKPSHDKHHEDAEEKPE